MTKPIMKGDTVVLKPMTVVDRNEFGYLTLKSSVDDNRYFGVSDREVDQIRPRQLRIGDMVRAPQISLSKVYRVLALHDLWAVVVLHGIQHVKPISLPLTTLERLTND